VVVYWIATLSVASEFALGGVWDLMRIDYVRTIVEHLGYPLYLLTIMGVWKIPAAVALLIRRVPRLQEWAYAGAVIDYASAVASHLTVGDGVVAVIAPTGLLVTTLVSYALRRAPAQR
jgi:hypothetical protein